MVFSNRIAVMTASLEDHRARLSEARVDCERRFKPGTGPYSAAMARIVESQRQVKVLEDALQGLAPAEPREVAEIRSLGEVRG